MKYWARKDTEGKTTQKKELYEDSFRFVFPIDDLLCYSNTLNVLGNL